MDQPPPAKGGISTPKESQMRSFINISLFFSALILCVAACDPVGNGSTDNDTVSSDDGSNATGDATGDGSNPYDGAHNDTASQDHFTITGSVPDGKPVTFYVFNRAIQDCQYTGWQTTLADEFAKNNGIPKQKFENVTTFAYSQKNLQNGDSYQTVCIYVVRDKYLFVPVETDPNDKVTHGGGTMEVKFDKYALWLNKAVCTSADGSIKKTLSTVVKNGEVVIEGVTGGSPTIPMKTYNSWSFEDNTVITTGTIADELSSIEFYAKAKNGAFEQKDTLFCK